MTQFNQYRSDMPGNWRQEIPVLVMECGATGVLGVVRSLGRAGYPVHSCAQDNSAIGLHSSFAFRSVVCPVYERPDFIPWLRAYIKDYGIKAIVPSEGFYHAIRPHYAEFEHLITVSCGYDVIYTCLSKADVFDSFNAAGPDDPVAQNIPKTISFSSPDELDGLRSLPLPLYIKTDECYNIDAEESSVHRVDDYEEGIELARGLFRHYTKISAQEPVPGRKATVNVCIVDGELLAESMCLATHENPHTGGLTALRHTWWHQAMHDDAMARIKHLGWEGVAMMEYRWDDENRRFYFLEMNSRYWAALHLDLFEGRDFPRIQLDALFGRRELPLMLGKQKPLTCRHPIPYDYGYAVTRARDPAVPFPKRLWALLEFVLLFFVPGIKSDLFFPGDRALYFRQWGTFIRSFFK